MAAQITAAQSQLYTWAVFTVAAPVGVFAISWPIAAVMNLPHPFLSTFGAGDIIPLAALILLGAAADVEHEALFGNGRSAKIMLLKSLAVLLAVFALAGYGALKAKALILLGTEPVPSAALQLLVEFSIVSILIMVLSLAIAGYAKLQLMNSQLSHLQAGGGRA